MAAVHQPAKLESAHQAVRGVDRDLQCTGELAHGDGLVALPQVEDEAHRAREELGAGRPRDLVAVGLRALA